MNYPVVISNNNIVFTGERFRLTAYLLLVGFVNLFALTAEPHWGDMTFWWSWVGHLRGEGYKGFDGNYPPVYIHWLYIVGQFYDFFNLSLAKNFLLKILVELPVITAHLILVRIVNRVLTDGGVSGNWYHYVMLIASVNPALIVDGPAWGQVDLLPAFFVVLALYFAASNRHCLFVMPLYILALLTKFQMICFAPVFAFYFFSNWQKQTVGVLLGLVGAVAIFLPFYVTGELGSLINNAYINTVGQYPYSTFNAANLWFLVHGNDVKDSVVLVHLGSNFELTAKTAGMLIFAIIGILVFSFGLATQAKRDILFGVDRLRIELVFASLLMAVAFFFVLPGMHERYLLPAVPVALLCVAYRPSKVYLAGALTLWVFLNIVLVNPIKGEVLWAAVAIFGGIIVLLIFTVELNSSAIKQALIRFFHLMLARYRWFAEASIAGVLAVVVTIMASSLVVPTASRIENGVWLSEFDALYSHQGWGTLNKNLNANAQALKARGAYYPVGLGVHAPSKVRYRIPSNYTHIVGQASLDDLGKDGKVKFVIKLDSKEVWNSGPITGSSDVASFKINLNGARQLELYVDELGDKNFDHANWLNIGFVNESMASE